MQWCRCVEVEVRGGGVNDIEAGEVQRRGRCADAEALRCSVGAEVSVQVQ